MLDITKQKEPQLTRLEENILLYLRNHIINDCSCGCLSKALNEPLEHIEAAVENLQKYSYLNINKNP